MKVVAIINPISGAGADQRVAASRIALLGTELERRGLRADIHVTMHEGHARALAADAVRASADLVIVWGGDGTANEAGAALIGTRVALGLIPAGSGNGLAAALGCPRSPAAAMASILGGRSRTIDAGMLDGRAFFNIAGIGVDARVAARFNLRAKGSRGRWPYIALGVREAIRYEGRRYDVELDGVTSRVRALLIAFANGGEYGNGARLTARARPDDGRLDAFIVEDRPVLARLWHSHHLVRGTLARAPGVRVQLIRHAVIGSDEPIEYHLDGEPGVAHGPLEVSIRPGALMVRG